MFVILNSSCILPYAIHICINTSIFQSLCFHKKLRNLHGRFDVSLVSVKSLVKILQFFVAFLENMNFTGKSLSEAHIFASTNPQYDDRLFIELQVQYMKIPCSAKTRASDKDLPVKFMFSKKITKIDEIFSVD